MYERLRGKLEQSRFTSGHVLAIYLAVFLAFNFFGVSLLSPSAWAPYTCTPGGDPWTITSDCDIRGTVDPAGSVEITSSSTVRVSGGNPVTWLEQGGLALYRMNSGSGSTLQDSSGNSYDGSISGPSWSSGRYDDGLLYDGSDDYVEVSSPPDPTSNSEDMTVSFWLNPDSGTGTNAIVEWDGGAHIWQYNSEDDFFFNPRGNCESREASGEIKFGQWAHYAVVYDSSASEFRWYVDGSLVKTASETCSPDTSSSTLRIGRRVGDSRVLDGKIDEVRIYDHALPQNAIRDLAGQPATLQVDFLTDYVRIGSNSKVLIYPGSTIFQ